MALCPMSPLNMRVNCAKFQNLKCLAWPKWTDFQFFYCATIESNRKYKKIRRFIKFWRFKLTVIKHPFDLFLVIFTFWLEWLGSIRSYFRDQFQLQEYLYDQNDSSASHEPMLVNDNKDENNYPYAPNGHLDSFIIFHLLNEIKAI